MQDFPDAESKNRCIIFYLFSMLVSVYLLTASGAVISDVGQLRIEVAKSIIERFDVAIPSGIGIVGADGRDYSWFGIGSVIISLPFYIFGALIGAAPASAVSIINQLVAAATATLLYLFICRMGYSKRTSVVISLFFGLGTIQWHYAKDASDHSLETFFVLLSAYCMYRYVKEDKKLFCILSGGAIGIAFLTRPTSLLIMPSLFLLRGVNSFDQFNILKQLRSIAQDGKLFFITFFPFVAIACWYNFYRFGNPFETGYALMAKRLELDFFTATSLFRGLAGFLLSPGKGFFFYSPITVLFFFSIKQFSKKHQGVAACIILTITLYLLFLSKNVYWHGDRAWGPRYLLVITPFLLIPVAAILDSVTWKKRSFVRRGVYILFGVSLGIQMLSISVNLNKYFVYLQLDKGVKFTVAQGKNVQPIIEPPETTYFTWSMSPILAQARFVREMIGNLKVYKYSEPPDDAPFYEKIRVIPAMNVFDFWWLYKYYVDGEKTGFVVAVALVLWASYCAARLRKSVL